MNNLTDDAKINLLVDFAEDLIFIVDTEEEPLTHLEEFINNFIKTLKLNGVIHEDD